MVRPFRKHISCTKEGCNKPHYCVGRCSTHYAEKRTRAKGRKERVKPLAWLMSMVGYEGDECLIYPFYRQNVDGQGRLYLDKTKMATTSSRVMCELVNGPPPFEDMDAAHSCG